MHLIGFSHHYTKIHGQTHGILLSARILSEEEYRELRGDKGAMYIDTVFIGNNGDEYVPQPIEDERLQLVFLGNRQIPFATYRKIPKDWNADIYGMPYSTCLNQKFIFKFKGEELPTWLAQSLGPDSVRIYE